MNPQEKSQTTREIYETFKQLVEKYEQTGLSTSDLQNNTVFTKHQKTPSKFRRYLALCVVLILGIIYETDFVTSIIQYLQGVRCLVPNNYVVWEATRPIADCTFCSNITAPIRLHNVSKTAFRAYAYSSQPIIIKEAFLHWPAMHHFDYDFFRELYERVDGAYRSVDEECQFLHLKSDFVSLWDVFQMTRSRVENRPGEKSWYVGWGNCHPTVLEEMRSFYPKPHFLPEDCEMPAKDYVFMGYDDGATLHLDFINRLMWQAQLRGSKSWLLLPPPECEGVCNKLSFLVEPGDAVLLDTRIWYHGTTIRPGEFSLSVQSEYG